MPALSTSRALHSTSSATAGRRRATVPSRALEERKERRGESPVFWNSRQAAQKQTDRRKEEVPVLKEKQKERSKVKVPTSNAEGDRNQGQSVMLHSH